MQLVQETDLKKAIGNNCEGGDFNPQLPLLAHEFSHVRQGKEDPLRDDTGEHLQRIVDHRRLQCHNRCSREQSPSCRHGNRFFLFTVVRIFAVYTACAWLYWHCLPWLTLPCLPALPACTACLLAFLPACLLACLPACLPACPCLFFFLRCCSWVVTVERHIVPLAWQPCIALNLHNVLILCVDRYLYSLTTKKTKVWWCWRQHEVRVHGK